MTDFNFLTPYQKACKERREKLIAEYQEAQKTHPNLKPHRIMGALAYNYGMSVQGVKQILIEANLYTVKHRAS